MTEWTITPASKMPDLAPRTRYPWAKMNAGEALYIPGGSQASMLGLATRWAKKNAPERKFRSKSARDGVWIIREV